MLHGHLLRVYDFDRTLFRSPEPPDDWSEEQRDDFFHGKASLSPPVVPEVPGDEWWVSEVEASMRADLQRRECGVVVLTGRMECYRIRIGRLLFDRGLVPNALLLKDTDGLTRDHKIQKMLRALRLSRGGIKRIDMWEDNHEDVDHFQAFFEAQGVPFTAHHVTSTAMPWASEISR